MSQPRNGEKVRLVRGRTIDTQHVTGGDLAGLDATVASEVYESDSNIKGNQDREHLPRHTLGEMDGKTAMLKFD